MSEIVTNVVKPSTTFQLEGVEYITLSKEFEEELDNSFDNIVKYITDNDGKGETDEVKNNLYGEAQKLWGVFKNNLDQTKYNFNLNKEQWKFLTSLITSKLEYDTNTVFVAIELDTLLKEMGKAKFKDGETQVFHVNATEVTYIYHLISTFKVKGLTADAFSFASVLRKIGDISKLVNFYDTQGKNIANDITKWVTLFDPNVTMEDTSNRDEVQFSDSY